MLTASCCSSPPSPRRRRRRHPSRCALRVEQLHEDKGRTVRGVRLLEPDAVSHFFQARNFAPAWQGAAPDQILQAIRDVEQDGLVPRDYHLAAIESLRAAPADSPDRDADLQILLTDAVAAARQPRALRQGPARPRSIAGGTSTRAPARRRSRRFSRTSPPRPSPAAAIEALKPSHFIYRGLKQALATQRTAASAGGWPVVPAGATLKPGVTNARIGAVRKRLAATGELAPASDSDVYDEALAAAVKRFQERHRLTADGAIGKATLDAMNVTRRGPRRSDPRQPRARAVGARRLERHVPAREPAGVQGVPDPRRQERVGNARRRSARPRGRRPSFRADMRYLVFNPDWTVPPTILAQDVLGAMRKGENAIAKKKLDDPRSPGAPVVPPTASTGRPRRRATFPYTLRQPPGPDNALGRVKFIFPNEHSIFLHDTPSQELFRADERTFSSGCIRVENPLELAAVLLEGQDDWNAASDPARSWTRARPRRSS